MYMTDTLQCPICDTIVVPNSPRQKFCSESCKQKNKRIKAGTSVTYKEPEVKNEVETYEQWLARRIEETDSQKSITVKLGYPAGSAGEIDIPEKWDVDDLDIAIAYHKVK